MFFLDWCSSTSHAASFKVEWLNFGCKILRRLLYSVGYRAPTGPGGDSHQPVSVDARCTVRHHCRTCVPIPSLTATPSPASTTTKTSSAPTTTKTSTKKAKEPAKSINLIQLPFESPGFQLSGTLKAWRGCTFFRVSIMVGNKPVQSKF